MDKQSKQPRVFISYSWTSEEYADRVEEFARALAADGIEVVLDQWDLKAGHDKHVFMEQSVVDPTINRVLILLDPRYVERANAREGGVGTETTIISGEVYARADQQKFIPVLMDRGGDEDEPRLPAYLGSRIYIDLSNPETYDSEYERLVRHIYEKPLRERPPLGKRPGYLDDDAVRLTTGRSLAIFKEAVLKERLNQSGFLQVYLDRVSDAYAAHVIKDAPSDIVELEEQVVGSIDRFLPYRDEFIDLIQFLGRFGERQDLYDSLHAFFEGLTTTRYAHRATKWADEAETENLGFIGWELFLYTVGILGRGGKFAGVSRLLEPYYVRSSHRQGAIRSFRVLDPGFRLLDEQRNRRLELRKLSLSASMAHDRVPSGFEFEILMEADSLLMVRHVMEPESDDYSSWWPRTLVYLNHHSLSSLPLWSRVRQDDQYFSRIAPVLTIRDRADAQERLVGEGTHFRAGFTTIGNRHIAEALGLLGR